LITNARNLSSIFQKQKNGIELIDPENTAVEWLAQCYKPEGRGFDSRWCHWSFLST
jgi:hypothetical protein